MSGFNPSTLDFLDDAISGLETFYAEVRAMFEFVETRFRIPEYGCALQSIEKHSLFSNASGYKLSDDSAYPYYLWVPSWLGRFYLKSTTMADDPSQSENNGPISFIWVWSGSGDAYVEDTFEPECWIGVASPRTTDKQHSTQDLATMIFQQFRVEHNGQGLDETGWINGRFYPNDIGCDLTGPWSLRRVPLRELKTYYQIEKQVIQPLIERHREVASGAALHLGS